MAPFRIDWPGIFTSEAALIEGVLRGTVIYFVLLALRRLLPRRMDGSLSVIKHEADEPRRA